MPLSPPIQAVAEHLRTHAVRTDGPFRLRSGRLSDWYLDARQTTFSGEGALLVGAAVSAYIGGADAVGGMTMGADPIAVAAAIHAARTGRPLVAFSIRKESKGHGTGGRLVGPVRSGYRVVMLEDTSTTGGTMEEAIDVAERAGLRVIQAMVLVDRSQGRVAQLMARRGIPYKALLLPEDLGVGPRRPGS